ncbi:MAG: HAMP domain-containing histidine kinase [bacterium]|nr:HAMP domain-containing histidine kinase [bacterium]
MFGQPSLRRRLILSYLVVVVAVTAAGFLTVQILVPRFFEQAVQERLGPGPQQNQGNQEGPGEQQGSGDQQGGDQQGGDQQGGDEQGGDESPGPGSTTSTTSIPTTTTSPDGSAVTTTTKDPQRTGSTQGPGGPGDPGGPGNGDGDDQGGNGRGGDNGNATTTTIDAFSIGGPGILAAGQTAQEVERSPVPAEIQEDYDRALTGALLVATAIGLAIALALGILLTRRLLGTFNRIKEGAGLLADGHYDTRVSVPREVELADLAESVNTLADSLQRTEQSRARLVSDLAHEIRNPLSTIEGYMEGLIDGVLPESKETYEAIAGEAHRLKRLTWDLSTLSKAQEGAMEFSFEETDLRRVVAKVIETLGPQYEVNDVALVVHLEDAMPVRVDVDRMAQAITNLLGNALAHTPADGSVTVSGSANSQQCALSITDTGTGIPNEQLETIFERFTRLDRDQPGTGIGLNIARTLVRAHEGDVTAASPGPGQGSTFEISLPRLLG